MVRRGRAFYPSFAAAFALLAIAPFVRAGDGVAESRAAAASSVAIPHTLDLLLAEKSRRRDRRPDNVEEHDFLDLTPGLSPLTWPRNSDVRARILTPELRRTPVVGWVAENLYRSRKDNGWCLEVDPGEGEYLVFYRFHPNR